MRNSAITIVKASGERQLFDPRKIEMTCRRAGSSVRLAKETAQYVRSRVREGTSTAEILRLAERCLRATAPRVALRYTLKDAMRRLGPAGFDFEKYVADILGAYGYATELPDLLPGMNVMHEVDVIARKEATVAMVECKYRNAPGIEVRLKDVMATWARFDDLREANGAGKCPVKFTETWMVTNTRITGDGLAFGNGKGMRCIGWRYPAEGGLVQMIEDRHLYPITILRSVDALAQERFAAAGLMLCHDILAVDDRTLVRQTGLSLTKIARIRAEITDVLRC